MDFSLAKSLDLLRHISCGEDQFAQTFFETFTTTSSADRTVELLPGGAHRDVTYQSRAQYCDLVLNVRHCAVWPSPYCLLPSSAPFPPFPILCRSIDCMSSTRKLPPSAGDSPPSCQSPSW